MNGRVPIPNLNQFMLFDKIPIKDKVTEYRDPTKGIWYESKLSTMFFSKQNINHIQQNIVVGVNKLANHAFKVNFQDENALKIIMRTIYLSCSKNLPNNFNEQIKELNNKVLAHCIPKVYGETVAYQKYLQDISTLVTPMDRPVLCTMKNKTLEPKFGF